VEAAEPRHPSRRAVAARISHLDLRRDRLRALPLWSAWTAGGLALLLLVIFDLGPPLAFNDDWLFTWSVHHLSAHVHLYPGQAPYALVQIVWAVAVGGLHHGDIRLLRLSLVPFTLLAGISSYRLARDLGADAFWAAVAGVLLLCTPIYMNLAASFMSDVPYVALVLATTLTGTAWVGRGKARAACVVLAMLATFQRQNGLLLAPALTAALLVRYSGRLHLGDLGWLAGLWLASGAALLLPVALGAAAVGQASHTAAISLVRPATVAGNITRLPAVAAVILVPFLGFLLTSRLGSAARRLSLRLGIAAMALIAAYLALFPPNNTWTLRGFGPLTILGPKPFALPPVVLGVLILAGAATAGSLVWRWRAFDPRGLRPGATLPLLVSSFQLLPILLVPQAFDRYYLPVLAPLVPVLAARAGTSGRNPWAAGWAVCCLAAGIAIFAVLEQDYQAWQEARDRAAQMAYQRAAPAQVNAGYEANAVYVELPEHSRSGWYGAVDGVGKGDPTVEGPPHPALVLVFAPPGDPRPGVSYWSLAPGRVVISPGEGASP
jgi:hypothetical protein